jgi:hypothetical protein
MSSLEKLGSLKSQSLKLEKQTEFNYTMDS